MAANWGKELGEAMCDVLGVLPSRLTWRKLDEGEAVALRAQHNAPHALAVDVGAKQEKPIIVLESHWATAFKRPSGIATTVWVLRSLPMLTFLLGFDQRDLALRATANGSGDRNAVIQLAGVFGRALTRVAIFFAFLFCLVLLIQQHAVVGVAVLVGTAALFSVPYLNVIGHVKVASATSEEYAKILARVRSDLSTAARLADNVSVIAHSQGGYIMHDLLSRENHPTVDHFVGVGSGLKPISLLQQMQSRRELALQWGALTLVIVNCVAVTLWNRVWAFGVGPDIPGYSFIVPGLNFMVGVPIQEAMAVESPVLADWFTWKTLLLLFLILGSVAGLNALRKVVLRSSLAEIKNIDTLGRWVEISSFQDVVGRSLFPVLPELCVEISVPVSAHPLLDHTRYFKKGGMATRLMARDLIVNAGQTPSVDYGAVASEGARRLRRAVRLRSWLVASFAGIITLPLLGQRTVPTDRVALVAMVIFTAGMVLSSPLLIAWQWSTQRRIQSLARRGLLRPVKQPSNSDAVAKILALAICITVAIFTCTSAITMQRAGVQSTDAVWGVGFTTLLIGVVVGAGYWSRFLIVLGIYDVLLFVQVWTSQPALPSLPYPLGQAGLFLSTACLLAVCLLSVHKLERVSAVLNRLGHMLAGGVRKLF